MGILFSFPAAIATLYSSYFHHNYNHRLCEKGQIHSNQSKDQENKSTIPEEVYLEILLRVPVKSTFVCKCVCKTWFSLISDPNFVKMHLEHTVQNNNPKLLLSNFDLSSHSYAIYSINYDMLSSVSELEYEQRGFVEIDYPLKSLHYGVDLLGSCNGLVCIWSNTWRLLCIWNPATKEYKIIPRSPDFYGNADDIGMYAFGYDCKNDDYKLVHVVDIRGNEDSCLVEVYMLGADSWKRIQAIPYRFPYFTNSGVLVNGILHWVGEMRDQDSSQIVISLDVSDERFEKVQLPKETLENEYLVKTVGVLEGCLCLPVLDDVKAQVHIWVMQDYGVRDSWTKRYSITHERITNGDFMGDGSLRVRLMWTFKNGEMLLKTPNSLVLYDPRHEVVREPIIQLVMYFSQEENYFESLVTLYSGTYVGRMAN